MAVASATLVVGLTVIPLVASTESADAQPWGDWDPGYIITDANFYAGGAMSATEVQAFLNSQVSTCTAGYTCLKDFRQSVPSMGANAYCGGLSGGSMTAAQLIASVAQSCNISPKVLLVLLQKEQSLVTATSPSATKYAKATGFSCPDTAPCDPAFASFFYQVYYAARQFQVYRLRPDSFNFRAGGTYGILLNPNAGCGRKTVTIANAATAGLYNYTPYTPNAAAMANLYGTGDGCSSYGNRNFWRMWWDWFGNPREKSGPEYIADLYAAQGGASGWLGVALSDPTSLPGGWMQAFAGGSLYWTASGGTQIVSGDMLAKYSSSGGPAGWLGWPYGSGATAATAHHVSGAWQWFQGGTMYWTAGSGAHVIRGAMKDYFGSLGGLVGRLGWPTSDETRVASGGGGVWQSFTGGSAFVRDTRATSATWDALGDYYVTRGGPQGSLGWPEGNEVPWTANGATGSYQYFQAGTVYSRDSLVVTVASGPLRIAYGASGGSSGPLGWPTADQVCTSDGSCSQTFQGGGLYRTATYGAFAVYGGMFAHYTSMGGPSGSLGWPTGVAACAPSGSCVQAFEAGVVTWTSGPGGGTASAPAAHRVDGAIGVTYTTMGGESGRLGSATSGVFRGLSGAWQLFEGGIIVAHGSTAVPVVGDGWAKYRDSGGPLGWLGLPVAASVSWSANATDGEYQDFENGIVYVSPGIGSAAAIATGPIRVAYGAGGGSSGPLGWPIGDAGVIPGGMVQQFQGGAIYANGTMATRVVGATAAHYSALGGSAGWLGWPIATELPWSANGLTGSYQDFQHGLVYSSPAGVAAVPSGPVRSAYSAAGGSTGRFGWPVSDPTCDGSRCEQVFQGGRIYSSGKTGFGMVEPVLGAYLATGGTSGDLGWPSSAPVPWVANGVSGSYTYFDGGLIYSSAATGTVVLLSGPIRTSYSNEGGGVSYLGWPTANAVCDSSGRCEQAFQGGRIFQSSGVAHPLSGSTLTKFQALGGTSGWLGWPVSRAIQWTANGVTGSYTGFDNGLIYDSAATGTYAVRSGPIRASYGAVGGSTGVLGWPVGDEVCDSAGNCVQPFQGGEVQAIMVGGTQYGVAGPMLTAYRAAGGSAGSLGQPASTALSAKAADVTIGGRVEIGTTGAWQYFASTAVIMYWTPENGVHTMGTGPIRTFYGDLGGLAGSQLGFPISEQACAGGTCTQDFEHGRIVSDTSGTRLA
jgi:uncharacterized protein with LGFP repeats